MKEGKLTGWVLVRTVLAIWIFGGSMWFLGFITGEATGETNGIETGKKLATIPSVEKK